MKIIIFLTSMLALSSRIIYSRSNYALKLGKSLVYAREAAMKNIEETISPLLLVLCLCGFGIFEYPRGQPRLYFTLFYILISWLFYSYATIKVRIYLKRYNMDLFIMTKVSIIFALLIALFSLYYNKRFKDCLKKLSIMNDTLEKLGTPKSYVKLRLQARWLIIAWIFSVCFMNMLDTIWFIEYIPNSYIVIDICLSCIMNQTLHINALSDVFHMMLLRYIGSRFEQINQHIENLTQSKNQGKCSWATSTRSLVLRLNTTGIETPNRIIMILMHVHLELCLITRELTRIFGIHMVMQAIAFNIFTAQLVNEFHSAILKGDIMSTYEKVIYIFVPYIWFATNIIKIIIFNCICEEIHSKAKKTEVFLNRLATHILDIDMQEYIIQFLYQLLQHPLRISGLGLYFGYKYLRECVSFIGTVIIVTLQLRPRA